MTPDEVKKITVDAIEAAIRNDPEAIGAHTLPLFGEKGSPRDCYQFTLGLVAIATAGYPRASQLGEQAVATPHVGRMGEDGQVIEQDIDSIPVHVAAYTRLCAAWVNEDKPMAEAIFRSLLDRGDGLYELSGCMVLALAEAAKVVRARRVRLQ